MDNVKFKYGLSLNLPQTKEPGSFLIETDTGKMFLDIDAATRKEIGGDVLQSYVDAKLDEKQDKHKYLRYSDNGTHQIGKDGYTDILITNGTISVSQISALYDLKSLFIAKGVKLHDGGLNGLRKFNVDFTEVNLETHGDYTVNSNIHFVGFTGDSIPLFTEEKTSVTVGGIYQMTWDADTKLDKSVIPTASAQDNGKVISVNSDGAYKLSTIESGTKVTVGGSVQSTWDADSKMDINPTSITTNGTVTCNSVLTSKVKATDTSTLEIEGSSVALATLPVGGSTPDVKFIVHSGDSTKSPSAFPFETDSMDLGTSTQKFKDLYISGKINELTLPSTGKIATESYVTSAVGGLTQFAVDSNDGVGYATLAALKQAHSTGTLGTFYLVVNPDQTDSNKFVEYFWTGSAYELAGGFGNTHVNNTTYTFTNGDTGTFTVTPSDGSAQVVSIGKPNMASNADRLSNVRDISLTGDATGSASFDGTANAVITTTVNKSAKADKLSTARNIALTGDASGTIAFDGTANVNINTTVSKSAKADKLTTARTISISGDATGSASFDGTNNATINTTVSKAASATKATQDGNGHVIATTYATKTELTANHTDAILTAAKAIAKGVTIYTYNIPSNKLGISVKTVGDNSYIDWGDGHTETVTAGSHVHTYAAAGVYEVLLTGPDTTQIFGDTSASNAELRIIKVLLGSVFSQIPDRMFQHCTNLKEVILPNTLTTLGQWAFESCTALSHINLPSHLTTIGRAAFNGCNALYEITIPHDVVTIAKDAFNGCTSIRMMYVEAITPPTLGEGTFEGIGNAALQFIVVPSGTMSEYQSAWSILSNKLAMTQYYTIL